MATIIENSTTNVNGNNNRRAYHNHNHNNHNNPRFRYERVTHYHMTDTNPTLPSSIPIPETSPQGKEDKKEGIAPKETAPWITSSRGYANRNLFLRLHEEINDFISYISPTRKERQERYELIQTVREMITEEFKSLYQQQEEENDKEKKKKSSSNNNGMVHIEHFGSFRTGLCLPKSDIDLTVFITKFIPFHEFLKSNDEDDKEEEIEEEGIFTHIEESKALTIIARALRKKQYGSFATEIQVIKARVPIIKFKHVKTGYEVDISINSISGLATATLMKAFCLTYTPLRSLVILIKQFLYARQLNETFSGGVGSYLLQLMVIAYLQKVARDRCHHSIRKNNTVPQDDLGHLLYGFFEFYGCLFNYRELGISVLDDGYFFKKENRFKNSRRENSTGNLSRKRKIDNLDTFREYSLMIENPDDPSMDVGANTFEIRAVSRCFYHAYLTLKRQIYLRGQQSLNDISYRGSMLRYILPIDNSLLERKNLILEDEKIIKSNKDISEYENGIEEWKRLYATPNEPQRLLDEYEYYSIQKPNYAKQEKSRKPGSRYDPEIVDDMRKILNGN